MNSPNYIAGGDIRTCRFVKMGAADLTVLESDANEAVIGISQEGAKSAPIPGASVLAAAAGENIDVHGLGVECLLVISDTVARGAYVKSDADGAGVTLATTGTTAQNVGAMALQSGVAGDKIRVVVLHMHKVYPALA